MANKYNCRIGKVTLRGGAELKIFRGGREKEIERLTDTFGDAADEILADYCDDIGGFVILHWDSEGRWIARWNMGSGNTTSINLNNLPEWAAGALRREVALYDIRRSEQSEETGE